MVAMIANATLAKLFAIAFAHVLPQCLVTMQIGDAWASTDPEASARVRRAIRVSTDRDVRLEERILSFRSRAYPGAEVLNVLCAKAVVSP